jgi:hypothetical protein
MSEKLQHSQVAIFHSLLYFHCCKITLFLFEKILVPNLKFWVNRCLLLVKTFPTSTLFPNTDLRAESYGLRKFRPFSHLYPIGVLLLFLHIFMYPYPKSRQALIIDDWKSMNFLDNQLVYKFHQIPIIDDRPSLG